MCRASVVDGLIKRTRKIWDFFARNYKTIPQKFGTRLGSKGSGLGKVLAEVGVRREIKRRNTEKNP